MSRKHSAALARRWSDPAYRAKQTAVLRANNAARGRRKEPPVASQQIPSIGRVVHYVAYGTPGGEFPAGAHRAAIITEYDARDTPIQSVGLVVLNPTGLFFHRGVLMDPTGQQPGSWHWPEYVPPAVVEEQA